MWTTLGDCLSLSSGTNIKVRESAIKGRFPVYGGNGINGYYDQYNVSNKTIVIGRVGFYCGSVHLTNTESWVTDNALIVSHDNMCDTSFLYYSLIWHNLSKTSNSTAQPVVSQKGILPLKTPIPPMSEQKRIVSAIEKYYKVIDSFEKDSVYLRHEISSLKSKILDLAISGKLVPQNIDDEPAIELLKKTNPRFQPCDNSHYEKLPEGWCVCLLKDIFEINMGQSPDGDTVNNENGVEFHQGKIYFTNEYLLPSGVYTSKPTKIAEANSLLLCVRAPVGILNITKRKICIGRGLCSLKPKYETDNKYWFYILSAYKDYFEQNATGSTFKAISGDTIKNTVVLLPPLNEQIRITKTISSLLSILDTITAELQ